MAHDVLSIISGKVYKRTFFYKDANGAAINLTGFTVTIIFKSSSDSKVTMLTCDNATNGGVTVSPVLGQIDLYLTKPMVALLRGPLGFFQVSTLAPDGIDDEEIKRGSFTIDQVGCSDSMTGNAVYIVAPGPQGIQGPSGTGASAVGTAGATISGDTAVVLVSGQIFPADPTNPAHASLVVGVALNGATIGNPVNYANAGDVGAGAWVQGSKYYVGLNGVLSTSPSASGATWMKAIGIAKTSSVLALAMGPSILF